MVPIALAQISVENLRGYSETSLRLGPLRILVGENNQGKSSMLKMLDWLMRTTGEFWSGDRHLDSRSFQFWYPANQTRHKARRFSIEIRFLDGRTARPFNCKRGDSVTLRMAVRATDRTCRLNIGEPHRGERHDPVAAQLLGTLKKFFRLVVLPPIRDGRSSSFADKATKRVREQIRQKLAHADPGGTSKEYRLAIQIIDGMKKIVRPNTAALTDGEGGLLRTMLKGSEVRLELSPDDVFRMLEEALTVYLSTGAHDELKVLPHEVGNGLQSMIDISLSMDEVLSGGLAARTILIVEEPEAFLHPSAQRLFMTELRQMQDQMAAVILTTHSPVIVDEARFEEVVVVRNQRHYEPSVEDSQRASINTSLLTSASAEILFARTLCFVEGEGDRAFFRTLFRRIRDAIPTLGELDRLIFQAAGGCRCFAPWLRLARSYAKSGEQAFTTLWMMDGDAAATSGGESAVLRLSMDCGFNMSHAERGQVVSFGNLPWDEASRGQQSVENINQIFGSRGGFLFCCDLEWALFNGVARDVPQYLRDAFAEVRLSADGSALDCARRLGSKIGTGRASDGCRKAPYIRAAIAERIPLNSLPSEVHNAVMHILKGCVGENDAPSVASEVGIAAAR